MGYLVADLEIDLYEYCSQWYFFNMQDFLVYAEYVDSRTYSIHIARLDSDQGWNIALQTLSWFPEKDQRQITDIGIQLEPSEWTKSVVIHTEFDIFPSNKHIPDIHALQYHDMASIAIHFQAVTLAQFNQLFPVAHLSESILSTLYVFGKLQDTFYCAHVQFQGNDNGEKISIYDVTYYPAVTLMKIAAQKGYDNFYFVVSNKDGGVMERMPWNPFRWKETRIVSDGVFLEDIADNVFPVFHSGKYILAASNHTHSPWLLDVPDRHYFYHNLNNSFRSFHRGKAFDDKIGRIVYAGNVNNSGHNNFKHYPVSLRTKSQRRYFLEDIVPTVSKDTLCAGGAIPREEMVEYKYILDIDGNGATWDATAWKLNSGSVLLKTDSIYRQWFYDRMVEGVHYLKVNDDFSNLQEIFEWCESHQDECKWISRNARALFQDAYFYRHILEDMDKLLTRYLV
jgi:hypothetical protein